jgi:hypothetical protein
MDKSFLDDLPDLAALHVAPRYASFRASPARSILVHVALRMRNGCAGSRLVRDGSAS